MIKATDFLPIFTKNPPIKVKKGAKGGFHVGKYDFKTLNKAKREANPAIYEERTPNQLRYVTDILNYSELSAKNDNFLADRPKLKEHKTHGFNVFKCSQGYLRTICPDNHIIEKTIVCGREWCRDCGKSGSIIHKRKIRRWIPYAEQMESFGGAQYLVITIPDTIRSFFATKKDLNDFRTFIRRYLKRNKLTGQDARGLMRYHFAGECPDCKNRKQNVSNCSTCEGTGGGKKFHPHLNILLQGSWIKPEDLEAFKNSIGKYFKRVSGKFYKANVNTKYYKKEIDFKHKVKYITRATWRFYDKKICSLIHAFRNNTVFGKFEKTETVQEATEKNCCPICLLQDGVINKLKTFNFILPDKFEFRTVNEVLPGIYYKVIHSRQPNVKILEHPIFEPVIFTANEI